MSSTTHSPPASSEAALARMKAAGQRYTAPELALRSRLHRMGLRYFVDHPPLADMRRRAMSCSPKPELPSTSMVASGMVARSTARAQGEPRWWSRRSMPTAAVIQILIADCAIGDGRSCDSGPTTILTMLRPQCRQPSCPPGSLLSPVGSLEIIMPTRICRATRKIVAQMWFTLSKCPMPVFRPPTRVRSIRWAAPLPWDAVLIDGEGPTSVVGIARQGRLVREDRDGPRRVD